MIVGDLVACPELSDQDATGPLVDEPGPLRNPQAGLLVHSGSASHSREIHSVTSYEAAAAAIGRGARHAIRAYAASPKATLVAIAGLVIGAGALIALSSAAWTITLHPLTYPDPERLVVIHETVPRLAQGYPYLPAHAMHFSRWRSECKTFDNMAAIVRAPMTLTRTGHDAREIDVARISSSFFATIKVRPWLGRDFEATADQAGGLREIILSDAFWTHEFNRDRGIIGRTIALNDTEFRIIGVLDSGFTPPQGHELGPVIDLGTRFDAYIPLVFTPAQMSARGQYDFGVIARLKQDASVAGALADVRRVQAQIEGESAGPNDLHLGARLASLESQTTAESGSLVTILLVSLWSVWFLVGANVASWMVTNTYALIPALRTRYQLGATRALLIVEYSTQPLIIGFLAVGIGLLVAPAVLRMLQHVASFEVPRLATVTVSWYAAGICAISISIGAIACAALAIVNTGTYAAQSSRVAVREADRTATTLLLVVGETAIATSLLICSIAFAHGFLNLAARDVGFGAAQAVLVDVSLSSPRYQRAQSRTQFYRAILGRLREQPGVDAVALTSKRPMAGESFVAPVALPGHGPEELPLLANYRLVSSDFFAALGIRLREGRLFESVEEGNKSAVVSDSVAGRLWPAGTAVGAQIEQGKGETWTVVGVVSDVPIGGLGRVLNPTVYIPYETRPPISASLIINTALQPDLVAQAVRESLKREDPGVPISNLLTVSDLKRGSVARERLETQIVTVLAGIGLIVACVGVHVVTAMRVENRQREWAIRYALGAAPASLMLSIVKHELQPVLVGGACGVLIALGVIRWAVSVFVGLAQTDLMAIWLGVSVVVASAAAASYGAALRIVRLEPGAILRKP